MSSTANDIAAKLAKRANVRKQIEECRKQLEEEAEQERLKEERLAKELEEMRAEEERKAEEKREAERRWYDCSAYMVRTTTLQTPQYKTKSARRG